MAFQAFAILVLLAVGANAQGHPNLPVQGLAGQNLASKATEIDCLVSCIFRDGGKHVDSDLTATHSGPKS